MSSLQCPLKRLRLQAGVGWCASRVVGALKQWAWALHRAQCFLSFCPHGLWSLQGDDALDRPTQDALDNKTSFALLLGHSMPAHCKIFLAFNCLHSVWHRNISWGDFRRSTCQNCLSQLGERHTSTVHPAQAHHPHGGREVLKGGHWSWGHSCYFFYLCAWDLHECILTPWAQTWS